LTDIGYDFTSCSYLDLNKDNGNYQFVDIDEWPGTEKKTIRIPTAFESDSKWGAQVSNIAERKPEEFVVPSKLMSIVKGDFRRYLASYISAMQDHVCSVIEKNGGSTDRSKFRYCITMENSYKFFFRKSEMRQVAVNAGLINKSDSTKRLLLVKREDAAAMHFEDEHFKVEGNEKKAFSSKFLQIFFRRDTCHLSLQEATKLSGYSDKRELMIQQKIEEAEAKEKAESGKKNELDNDNDADDNDENSKDNKPSKEKYFRNVRGVRSAVFPFNFISKLIINLEKYVKENNSINCPKSNDHEINYNAFDPEFKEGFLNYIEVFSAQLI
jgi:hypothetical protein